MMEGLQHVVSGPAYRVLLLARLSHLCSITNSPASLAVETIFVEHGIVCHRAALIFRPRYDLPNVL